MDEYILKIIRYELVSRLMPDSFPFSIKNNTRNIEFQTDLDNVISEISRILENFIAKYRK